MSPPPQFGLAASMSAGDMTTRATVALLRFVMWRPIRSTIRSAYASRSSSVHVPPPTSISPAASPFGLGRKQAAVGLVDCARDPVEAGGEVEERRAREALVAAPARQLVHGDVDLHLAAAVAKAQRPVANRGGCVALAEQTSIELRRRDAGQHPPRC